MSRLRTETGLNSGRNRGTAGGAIALMRYFSRFDDGEVVRWAFRGLLIGTIGVLALDLRDLAENNGWWQAEPLPTHVSAPILPPAVDTGDADAVGRPAPSCDGGRGPLRPPDELRSRPRRRPHGGRQHRARHRRALCGRAGSPRRICQNHIAQLSRRRPRRCHGHGQLSCATGASRPRLPTARSAPRPAPCCLPAG